MRIAFLYGHMHHVLTCLNAGNLEGAASWVERDLEEPGGSIDPQTLRIAWPNELYDGCDQPAVAFETFAESQRGMHGDGI